MTLGQHEDEKMVSLFRVTTTIYQVHDCKNLSTHWFMIDRTCPVAPYAELIEDYAEAKRSSSRYYAEGYVDELFTAKEAEALQADLSRRPHSGCAHVVTAVSLPVEFERVFPYGAIPTSGEEDRYMLYRRDDWALPFKVAGYVDLRNHEAASWNAAVFALECCLSPVTAASFSGPK